MLIEYFLFIVVATRSPKIRKDLAGGKEGEKRKRGRPRKLSASNSVDGKLFIFIVYFVVLNQK